MLCFLFIRTISAQGTFFHFMPLLPTNAILFILLSVAQCNVILCISCYVHNSRGLIAEQLYVMNFNICLFLWSFFSMQLTKIYELFSVFRFSSDVCDSHRIPNEICTLCSAKKNRNRRAVAMTNVTEKPLGKNFFLFLVFHVTRMNMRKTIKNAHSNNNPNRNIKCY